MDALIAESLSETESDSITLRGIEIKVDLHDLKSDHKMAEYADYCDYLYLAIPADREDMLETAKDIILPSWGIMTVSKSGEISVVREPQRLDAIFRDRTLSTCLLKLIPTAGNRDYFGQGHARLIKAIDMAKKIPGLAGTVYERYLLDLKKQVKEKMLYNESHTAWQWLANYHRVPTADAVPYGRRPSWWDPWTCCEEVADKVWYYYPGSSVVKVGDRKYNELKQLYIEQFGGWDTINLETTDYDGHAWW